jgi:hypothetical protein
VRTIRFCVSKSRMGTSPAASWAQAHWPGRPRGTPIWTPAPGRPGRNRPARGGQHPLEGQDARPRLEHILMSTCWRGSESLCHGVVLGRDRPGSGRCHCTGGGLSRPRRVRCSTKLRGAAHPRAGRGDSRSDTVTCRAKVVGLRSRFRGRA